MGLERFFEVRKCAIGNDAVGVAIHGRGAQLKPVSPVSDIDMVGKPGVVRDLKLKGRDRTSVAVVIGLLSLLGIHHVFHHRIKEDA